MQRTVGSGESAVVIEQAPLGDGQALCFSSHHDVTALLATQLHDQEVMMELRVVLGRLSPGVRISNMTDHMVLESFAWEVLSGAVALRRGGRDMAQAGGGAAADRAAPAPASEATDQKAAAGDGGGPLAKNAKATAKRSTASKRKYSVVTKGKKETYTPTKPNGKTLYFYFGFKPDEKDKGLLAQEAPKVEDDIKRAARSGFKVVYGKQASRQDFLDALYDPRSAGLYWSGHGYMNGNVQSSSRETIGPEDVDKTRVNPKLQFVILAACGSGLAAKKWKAVLPAKANCEGWTEITTTKETIDFTTDSLPGDGLWSHHGMNPDKELDDYIDDAK